MLCKGSRATGHSRSCGLLRSPADPRRYLALAFILYLPDLGAQVGTLDFEDLSLGASYAVPATFQTNCIPVDIQPLFAPGTACTGATTAIMAVVENTSLACGSGDELHLNNVNAIFRFGVSLTNVEVKYGEYGGNINVEVNGQCENVDNFIDLPPTMGLGPPVTVMAVDVGTPGNSCGVLTLTGTVNSLTIGGQELWVDELRSTTVDFVRGDANADSTVNITDPIFVLLYLFRGGTCPTCLDSADADDNGAVQITDAIVLLNCLFGGGGPLPPPTPMPTKSHYDPLLSCGPDVMPDTLWCPVFGPCP